MKVIILQSILMILVAEVALAKRSAFEAEKEKTVDIGIHGGASVSCLAPGQVKSQGMYRCGAHYGIHLMHMPSLVFLKYQGASLSSLSSEFLEKDRDDDEQPYSKMREQQLDVRALLLGKDFRVYPVALGAGFGVFEGEARESYELHYNVYSTKNNETIDRSSARVKGLVGEVHFRLELGQIQWGIPSYQLIIHRYMVTSFSGDMPFSRHLASQPESSIYWGVRF